MTDPTVAGYEPTWVPGEEPDAAFCGDARREVIIADGPETIEYLHGQLSQDIVGLAEGSTTWSFLLEPNGKVLAHLRLTRTGPSTVMIDADAGMGEAVQSSLDRFKLRTKVTFEMADVSVVGLRGADAVAVADSVAGSGGHTLPTLWPSPAVDVVVPGGLDLAETAERTSLAFIDDDAWESARIRAGVARVGVDIDDSTIPAESGLVPLSVSFTKGCYRGQELVERIDARGAIRRVLVGLVADDLLVVGDTLLSGERQVGAVTSATRGIRVSSVGLGYVRQEALAGAALETSSGVPVRVSGSA